MIFKRYEWRLILRVLTLFVTLLAAAFILLNGLYIYLLIVVPISAYELVDMIRFNKKAQEEIGQFVESIQYRDFSRHFDVGKAPGELKELRKGFNDINSTFKLISREKETQYHYLQKILELVDTGIISYEQETGEIIWINESFKNLLHIPYLKTIQSLAKREPVFYNDIISIKPGDNKLVTITRDQQQIKILVNISVYKIEEKIYKLLALQNVSEALDETESKAWQKLLNIMTHEIMNSVAPISSLAETLKNRLQSPQIANNVAAEELQDLKLGIDTIKRRSEGLLKFTESYRNLNKITQLDLEPILVCNLLENINSLMLPTLEKKQIELDIIIKDLTLVFNVDINLIEQVLINLLINAVDAVKDNESPHIILSAEAQNNRTIIKVSDNGSGMSSELIDKIFIPFFSTRKTGSGIGLSLCKQIMLLHKGNIQVQSIEGKGSVFTLQFSS